MLYALSLVAQDTDESVMFGALEQARPPSVAALEMSTSRADSGIEQAAARPDLLTAPPANRPVSLQTSVPSAVAVGG